VIRADGLLLMAGAPLPPDGTLTARFSDGRELPAEQLASDVPTALTLLRVRAANLVPLVLRPDTRPAPKVPAAPRPAGDEPAAPPDPPRKESETPVAAPTVEAPAASAPAPLRYPPLGLRIAMVTSDDAVAFGVVRGHGRYGRLFDAQAREAVPTTGLLGAAIAAVDEDVGAPFLDDQGRLVGLLVGRKAVIAPERGEEAARVGLRLRPEPREAVAVPASVIGLVWPLLERYRRVPRAGLGVRTLTMDDVLRAQLDLEGGGHVIREIDADSPAARHGLEQHDIIVEVDGRRIEPGVSLQDVLLPYRPGDSVKLGIYRAGERITVPLRLAELR